MANGNFTNGAMVFRVWNDGSAELLAKFQYFMDAKEWARMKAEQEYKPDAPYRSFFLATCEHDCEVQSYTGKPD